MICHNCQTSLPDEARFCRVCGEPVTAFAPPEGFEIDPVSLRYFRNDGVIANAQYTTWFDPDTGQYEQSSTPVEPPPAEPEPFVPEPEPIPEPEPEPEHVPEPVPPPVNIPFTLDPSSGLYYTATPGTDPATGAAGHWYTWFYPETGEFKQAFSPDPAAAAQPKQTKVFGGVSKPGGKGIMLLLILLPVIGLLGGGVFAFIQAGGFALFNRGEREIPPGIEIVTVDDIPMFTPVTDSSGAPGTDDPIQPPLAPTDSDPTPSTPPSPIIPSPEEPAIPEQPAEQEQEAAEESGYIVGAENWGELYSAYIESLGFEYRAFEHYQDFGTFPAYTLNGTTYGVSTITFYYIEPFEYPIMVFTQFAERADDPDTLDTHIIELPHVIRNGEVTWETNRDEEYYLYIDNLVTGEPMINATEGWGFDLADWALGGEGAEKVAANIGDMLSHLADNLSY